MQCSKSAMKEDETRPFGIRHGDPEVIRLSDISYGGNKNYPLLPTSVK